MKKLLLALASLSLLSVTTVEAAKIQGAACYMEGNYTGFVKGSFNCGDLGANLTIAQIYQMGWRIVSSAAISNYCGSNTCGGSFTIFIEKQN